MKCLNLSHPKTLNPKPCPLTPPHTALKGLFLLKVREEGSFSTTRLYTVMGRTDYRKGVSMGGLRVWGYMYKSIYIYIYT